MVAKGLETSHQALASNLLSYGLVQTSLGQKSKDSSKERGPVLKPLAQNSVYTDADHKRR
jgi:hypothetical protein